VNSSSCGRTKERDDSPILDSRSPRGLVRLLRSPTFDASCGYTVGSCTAGSAKVEVVGFDGANPGGLDHFPGAGAPRDGTKETDGLGLRPPLDRRDACESRLCGAGLSWLSALFGGFCDSGFAHFEIGGAHFPRPADVDVASGDGGTLLLGISHLLVRALTCVEQRVSI
jgi:hypothetical protein